MPLEIQGSGKITGLTDPAADSDAARKKFVEEKVAEVETVELARLEDVNTAGVNDGDVLTYFDGDDAYWGPGQLPESTDDLDEGIQNLYYTDARVDTQTATNRAPLYFVENIVTADHTLVLADVAKVVAFNSASNLTLTVPTNASVPFPIGAVINVYRAGTGTVTIAGESGVTVRNPGAISAQFVEVSLRKRETDEWVLSGDVS